MRFLLSVLRDLVLPMLCYAGVVAVKLLADASYPGIWIVVGATLLIAIAELLSETNDDVAAFLFTARVQVAVAVLLAAVGASITLVIGGSQIAPQGLEVLRAMIVGLGVGAGMRHAYVGSFRRRRQHRPTYRIRLLLLMVVGVVVLLLPGDGQAVTAGSYILCIGIGFLVHFLWRRWDEHSTQSSRMNQMLLKPLQDPSTARQRPIETLAATMLADKQLPELAKLLQGGSTPGLALIEASLQRHQRKNLEAIKTLDRELQRPERIPEENDALLHLLKGICHRDGGEYGAMNRAFDDAGRLVKGCFAQCLMSGLSRLEELPAPADPAWDGAGEARQHATALITEAVRLNAHGRPRLAPAAVVANALPLNRTFFDDVQGYEQFKNGNMSTSKKIFEACIEEDSQFAPAYLHLGEWHLAFHDLVVASRDSERAEESLRAARFCFKVAVALGRSTHTGRRALEFLKAGAKRRQAVRTEATAPGEQDLPERRAPQGGLRTLDAFLTPADVGRTQRARKGRRPASPPPAI